MLPRSLNRQYRSGGIVYLVRGKHRLISAWWMKAARKESGEAGRASERAALEGRK